MANNETSRTEPKVFCRSFSFLAWSYNIHDVKQELMHKSHKHAELYMRIIPQTLQAQLLCLGFCHGAEKVTQKAEAQASGAIDDSTAW